MEARDHRSTRTGSLLMVVCLALGAVAVSGPAAASTYETIAWSAAVRAEERADRAEHHTMQALYNLLGAAGGAMDMEVFVRDIIEGRSNILITEEQVLKMLALVTAKVNTIGNHAYDAQHYRDEYLGVTLDKLVQRAEEAYQRDHGAREYWERARQARSRVERSVRLVRALVGWAQLAKLQIQLTCTDAEHAFWRPWWTITYVPTNRGDLQLSGLKAFATALITPEDRVTPAELIDRVIAGQPYVQHDYILLDPPPREGVVSRHVLQSIHPECGS